jgi:hypothetical protein
MTALETLLAEVEGITRTAIATAFPVTGVALDCCRRIRDALASGDVASAAIAGSQLGERLVELREIGAMARRDALYVSPTNRVHGRDVARRQAYLAARDRGFSTTDAYKKAGAALGVSPKTIMRAVLGH